MVDSLGLSYAMDGNVATHTNGAATATNISGANQTGSSVTVVAVAGGTLAKGTVITLPGVYAVNPQSRQSTGVLGSVRGDFGRCSGCHLDPDQPGHRHLGRVPERHRIPDQRLAVCHLGRGFDGFTPRASDFKDAFTLACVPMWAPPGGKGVIDVAQESQGHEHQGDRVLRWRK